MSSYRAFLVILLWLAGHALYSQDTVYARVVISHLCDQSMYGRGFVRNGDQKAADYIRHQFEANGILPFKSGFFQSFPIGINTFPGAMKVSLNKKILVPGRDFMVDPASPGLNGRFTPVFLNASDVLKGMSDTLLNSAGNKVVIVDARDLATEKADIKRLWNEWKNSQQFDNPYKIKALIEVTNEKLVFGAATGLSLMPIIIIKGSAYHYPVASLDIHIKNKYIEEYRTQNVVGYVPGTACPDSFLVYTAHYDHLGMMGKGIFFPGANDNASGTAMMLGLARFFSRHPQRYSVAFIGFTGEEAGLLGSGFFADHSLISLSNIKFLVNLDLVGTGVDGITVVNATEFPHQFEMLCHLNDTGRYLVNIKKRGKACNSDHCPFYTKGVPCFFIYTLGGIAAYHNLDDRPETLPLTAFEALSKLLIAFGEKL
jgi:aminopeptidase YwaD